MLLRIIGWNWEFVMLFCSFVKGRDYDPDREQAEKRKLQKQVKHEVKGATWELWIDAFFLLELKEKERAEKYEKALAFLQEQEHGIKSGQLGKGRKRGRWSWLLILVLHAIII